MTTQAAFTPQEWTLLRTVPALVASGVAAADPGGILGGMKEAFAGMKGMFDSLLIKFLIEQTDVLGDAASEQLIVLHHHPHH